MEEGEIKKHIQQIMIAGEWRDMSEQKTGDAMNKLTEEQIIKIAENFFEHDHPHGMEIKAFARAIESAIASSQPSQSPVVPEGWQMAPNVLVNDLHDACDRAVDKGYGWHGLDELMQNVDAAYAAQLPATPSVVSKETVSTPPAVEQAPKLMPPLPAPYYPQWSHSNELAAFTAEQMRAYALAALASQSKVRDAGGWFAGTEDCDGNLLVTMRADEIASQSKDREDAERYRWLRNRENSLETQQRDKNILNGPSCYHSVDGIQELKHGDELDVAIDAACSQEARK